MKLQCVRGTWFVIYTEIDTLVRLAVDIHRASVGSPVPITFRRPGESTDIQAGLVGRGDGSLELVDPTTGIFRLDARPMEIEIDELYLIEGPLADVISFRVPMVDSQGKHAEHRGMRFLEAKALMRLPDFPDDAISPGRFLEIWAAAIGFLVHKPGDGQVVSYVSIPQRSFSKQNNQYRALYTGDRIWSETELEIVPVLPNDTKDIYLNQADIGDRGM